MAAPQSPNSHLTMNMLNNLMHIQGLENTIVQQQSTTTTNPPGGGSQYNPQVLEQQIKLSQLQQLQQLQNQIFQQQIALISGSSPTILPTATEPPPPMFTGLPTPVSSGEIRPQQSPVDFGSPMELGNFIDPLPHALVPPHSLVSPSSPSSHSRSRSHGGGGGTLNLQKQLQAIVHSHQQNLPPSSPATFGSPTASGFHPSTSFSSHSSSPPFGNAGSHPASPNTFGHMPSPPHQHRVQFEDPRQSSSQHGYGHFHTQTPVLNTPRSNPEHIAFNIYGEPDKRSTAFRHTLKRKKTHDSHEHDPTSPLSVPILEDQDISPLTSPWLGAHGGVATSHGSHRSSQSLASNNNKRTASPSEDESTSSRGARKKMQSPVRPMVAIMTLDGTDGDPSLSGPRSGETPSPQTADGSVSSPLLVGSNSISRKPYRGSRSTNSTPLLRSTPSTAATRSKRKNSSAASGSGFHQITTSGSSSVPMNPTFMGAEDTPSPVNLDLDGDPPFQTADRLMPPPPLPISASASPGASSCSSNHNDSTSSSCNGTNSNPNPNSNSNQPGMDVDMNMNAHMMDSMANMGFGSSEMGMTMDEMNMNMGMGMNNMGMGMGMGMNNMGMGGMNMGMDMNMELMGMSNGMGWMDFDGQSQGRGQQHQHQQRAGDQSQDQFQQQQDGSADATISNMGMGLDSRRSQNNSQPQTQPRRQSQSQPQSQPQPQPRRQQQQQQQQQPQQQPLVPVTPASIMNLGRLGINTTASALPSSSGTGGKTKSSRGHTKDSGGAGAGITTRSTARGGKRGSIAPSPILKAILPAGNLDLSMTFNSSIPNTPVALKPLTPSSASGASSAGTCTLSMPGPPAQVRKTSHKAAEQKRRDSLKTTFDDLRKLLPPIALSADPELVDGNPASVIASPLFLPTVSLLPGALPPRGPPKAGGEGPNKGVSKLQLLICGNEFIRILKARVDRRDEEIEKLREEVGRLRGLVGEGGADEDGRAGQLDLQRDLDACERVGVSGEKRDKEKEMAAGKSDGKAATTSTARTARSNLDDDLMDEDEEGEGE